MHLGAASLCTRSWDEPTLSCASLELDLAAICHGPPGSVASALACSCSFSTHCSSGNEWVVFFCSLIYNNYLYLILLHNIKTSLFIGHIHNDKEINPSQWTHLTLCATVLSWPPELLSPAPSLPGHWRGQHLHHWRGLWRMRGRQKSGSRLNIEILSWPSC